MAYIYQMKKALLILMVAICTNLGQAQNGLFETVLTIPFNNSINDIETHSKGWLAAGSEGDCYTPYLYCIDSTGTVVWSHSKPHFFGFAYYSKIAKNATAHYIAGNNMIADDYPSHVANGFVDKLDQNDSVVNVITDTLYKGGFHNIALNDTLILVGASKQHFGSRVPFVACYDIAGNWLWEHEFVGMHIINIHFIDTMIWVVTDSIAYQLNHQGQLLPNSIIRTSIASYISNDTLLALVDANNAVGFYNRDANFLFFDTYGLTRFDLVDLYSAAPDVHYALMRDSITDLLLVIEEGGIPSKWVEIPRICTQPKALALMDSLVAVAGNLVFSEAHSSVIKTATLANDLYTHQTSVEVVACSLLVDSNVRIYTPSFNVITISFDGRIIVWAVNTGQDTIRSLTLQTEMLWSFNCAKEYGFTYFPAISLAPGDTIVDTFYLYNINKTLFSTNILDYEVIAIGPNHKLSSNCLAPFKSTPYIVVGIDEITLAESIKAYPNPFSNSVSFTNMPHGASIGLYNLQGQLLLRSSDTNVLNVEGLSSGMYLYHITGSNGKLIKTGKLVKE